MLDQFQVFQKSKEFYWRCNSLKVRRILRDQLSRASSSVALNIAEGSGKRTATDQARYYGIALGSVRECQAIMALEKIDDPVALDLANQLGKMLYKLSRRNETSAEN